MLDWGLSSLGQASESVSPISWGSLQPLWYDSKDPSNIILFVNDFKRNTAYFQAFQRVRSWLRALSSGLKQVEVILFVLNAREDCECMRVSAILCCLYTDHFILSLWDFQISTLRCLILSRNHVRSLNFELWSFILLWRPKSWKETIKKSFLTGFIHNL